MDGSRASGWLWRQCVSSQCSSRLPLRDHLESLMHYSSTNFCACVMPSWALTGRADHSLCPPIPIIRSHFHRPGFNTCVSLVQSFYRHLVFYFIWISLRSVHLCHSVERISHIPLDTSATLTSCATNRSIQSTTPTTYDLVDSKETNNPSVVQSLLDRSSICFITISVHCTTITRG